MSGLSVICHCNDGEQECISIANTDTFVVSNNHVHHGGPGTNGGEGIDLKDGTRNGKVYGNHIHHMNTDRTGLYLDAWDKHTYNIEVCQNRIHDCFAGITLASEMGGLLEQISVYNNLVFRNRAHGLEIGDWGEPGVQHHPVENVTFVNNAVEYNGIGAFEFQTGPSAVGSPAAQLPDKYEIRQNYPNPFNAGTVISFSISQREKVIVKIFNLLGEEIVTLLQAVLEPGVHSVHWYGGSLTGDPVPSGIYIYVLQAGDFTAARKAAVVR